MVACALEALVSKLGRRVRVANALWSNRQANLPAGCWTGAGDVGLLSSQHGKQQGVKSTSAPRRRGSCGSVRNSRKA